MNDESMQKLNKQIEQALAPARQFISLSVDHTEKLANFQLQAAKSYMDFGLEQTRGALRVNDTSSFQDYMSKQQEAVSTLSRKISEDVETLSGYGKDYAEAATKVAQDNVVSATDTAKSETSKSRKSA